MSPYTYLALDGITGLIPIVLILGLFDNPFLIPKRAILFAVVSGFALGVFFLTYFYVIQIENLVVVIILLQTTPVFLLVLGLTILQEEYEIAAYLGMFLILLGVGVAAIGGNIQKEKMVRGFNRKTVLASIITLSASFILSLAYLAQKVALQDTSIIMVLFWQRVCLLFISFLIFPLRIGEIRKLSVKPIVLTIYAAAINLLAMLSIITAYSRGPFGIVAFISSLQIVLVPILVSALNSSLPAIFPTQKNTTRFQQIVASAAVTLGLFLVLTSVPQSQ